MLAQIVMEFWDKAYLNYANKAFIQLTLQCGSTFQSATYKYICILDMLSDVNHKPDSRPADLFRAEVRFVGLGSPSLLIFFLVSL